MELLTVLTLVAVLLGLAAPSFQESIQRNRLQSTLNDVVSMVAFARAEAVTRAAPVSVCASADGASCGASGEWEKGWIVFVDDGAGTSQNGAVDTGEPLVRVGGPAPTAVSLRAFNFPSSSSITFTRSGRMNQDSSGTFVICDDRGVSQARAVVLNVSGQPRLSIRDSSGTLLDDNNAVITSCT
jgi:type IV fimbrial biogenesis protein FimT